MKETRCIFEMKLKLPGYNIGDVCLIACDPEHGSDFREFIIICILLCAEKQRASCSFSKLALCVEISSSSSSSSLAIMLIIGVPSKFAGMGWRGWGGEEEVKTIDG